MSVDDYIQLEDGRTGIVRELNMRSTTLETFDGKDVMVPNEKFIVETFTNWTHKNNRQRYRVDFSVAYDSDIRALVEIIKGVVATHPQVHQRRPTCLSRSGPTARLPASAIPASTCSSSSGWRVSTTAGTASAAICC